MHRQVARRPRRLAGTLTLVAAACAGSSGGGTATVVEVVAQPCDTPNRDIGLGVVVGDGLVMTAAHTVEGPRRAITVDGMRAALVALDARTDLALLSADIDGEPAVISHEVPPRAVLRTADGEQTVEIVRTGRLVVNDATEGTRHRREVHTFTPGVRAGTSGAPLVDADGAVIGVVVLANRGDGTAYAVTAEEIAVVLGARNDTRHRRDAPAKVAAAGGTVRSMRGGSMRRSIIRSLALVAALALVVGACSDDDDDGASEDTEAALSVAPDASAAPDSVATADTAADTTTAGTEATTPGTGSAEEVQTGESLLDTVIANDVVRCGVRDDLAGFAVVDDAGEYVGFDADFCRVIAAGVLGDATKVEFVPVATDARFPALQAGEIDVLVRNTTWTASRDGNDGANFLHPTFYDGQQMMVAADSGYASIDDMDAAVVCVAAGTTTEGNVATEFAARGLTVDVQSFEDIDLVQEAFIAGQCDGWSSDGSQLASRRANYPDGPDALVIFEDVFSKEPLTPAVIDGDTQWAQAVEWSIYATIAAEELGITSATADADAAGDDAAKVQFLGGASADGTVLDPGLGLPTDFALQIVTQVGNYGEIFEANLPAIGVTERGLNALWSDGGLQYAPPYR